MNRQVFEKRRAGPRRRLTTVCAAVFIGLSGAAFAGDAAIVVRDGHGRQVRIADPSRIISIGGAITEILYALDLQDRIIAVDTTSLYPPSALKDKPNVGYMRALSPEGVLGLGPSLVLATDGAGPKQAVAVLEAAAIPFVHVPERFTAEGIVERIRLVAAAAGRPARGECLARNVEAGLARLDALRKGVEKPLRVAFVLALTNGRPLVAGRGTAADGIIRLAGGANAFADFDGYKAVSDEAIVAAEPDAVLGVRRGDVHLTPQEIFSQPAFGLTPAAKNNRYILMEALYLLGFGPRTAQAAGDLARTLYPSLAGSPDADSAAADCRE